MSAIFISHSSRDNQVADEIRNWLAELGHRSVFLDFDPAVGIPAGRDWEQELYLKIRACRAVIVLCSKHSMASRWCFMEITHARALGKHLFPVKIDDCELDPARLAGLRRIEQEAAALELRKDVRASRERDKRLSKLYRSVVREKRSRRG